MPKQKCSISKKTARGTSNVACRRNNERRTTHHNPGASLDVFVGLAHRSICHQTPPPLTHPLFCYNTHNRCGAPSSHQAFENVLQSSSQSALGTPGDPSGQRPHFFPLDMRNYIYRSTILSIFSEIMSKQKCSISKKTALGTSNVAVRRNNERRTTHRDPGASLGVFVGLAHRSICHQTPPQLAHPLFCYNTHNRCGAPSSHRNTSRMYSKVAHRVP